MNGRIYDPTLGRFLQADPHIQAPKNSQSYNRYSYVLNNPLSFTDPSGYSFSKLVKKWLPVVMGAIVMTVPGLNIFVAGSLSAWIRSGLTLDAQGVLMGGVTGVIAGASANFGSVASWGDVAKRIAVGAAGGCLAAKTSGGSCRKGAGRAALVQAVSIGIEKFSGKPTLNTPDDKSGVYKMNKNDVADQVHCVECDVTNTNANNIGIGLRSESEGQIVGSLTPDTGWLSFNEGSTVSRGLAHIPGFNSGAVFHDTLVGTLERSMGMQEWSSTAQTIGGLFINQMTIVPAIALNYYATGILSYDDNWDNEER